jgi:glycine oxidase
MLSGVAAEDFEIHGGRIRQVQTTSGPMSAGCVCIATGAWSQGLVARLGAEPKVKPIRGQIALLSTRQPVFKHVINEGPRYFVPRPDGRLLVGSTEEDAGFDRSTTAGALAGLLDFAIGLAPSLADAKLECTWAGLRPSTPDGQPYIGRVAGLDNAFVAAGHFRSGLHLSTGTAVVMSQLIRGLAPQIDLTPFQLDRVPSEHVDMDSPHFENVFH